MQKGCKSVFYTAVKDTLSGGSLEELPSGQTVVYITDAMGLIWNIRGLVYYIWRTPGKVFG